MVLCVRVVGVPVDLDLAQLFGVSLGRPTSVHQRVAALDQSLRRLVEHRLGIWLGVGFLVVGDRDRQFDRMWHEFVIRLAPHVVDPRDPLGVVRRHDSVPRHGVVPPLADRVDADDVHGQIAGTIDAAADKVLEPCRWPRREGDRVTRLDARVDPFREIQEDRHRQHGSHDHGRQETQHMPPASVDRGLDRGVHHRYPLALLTPRVEISQEHRARPGTTLPSQSRSPVRTRDRRSSDWVRGCCP